MPGVTPHPGSLPSGCIPAGRLTDPHAGRTDRRREARNGRSTAPRLSGDRRRQGRVRLDVARPCVPRPIPWPCSSAFTRRTFTAPASRGTTSRPAGPCSSPGNSSSAHHGVGSPGWASVWGAGPACRRGHFRPRPGARVGGDDPQAEARVDAHPAAVTGRGHDDHAGTRVTPDGHRRVQQP